MSAPTLLKTWQIEGDNLVPTDSTIYIERKNLLLGIINKLIGFASNPMTVIGSNNGTASGMDAVNRWATIADLNNNSWIVLQQAGINAKFQICFHLNANWTSGVPQLTMVVSRLAGFGTANGGTDGSTSARPTATDEHAQTVQNLTSGGAVSIAARYYVWQSTDGQMTQVMIRNATAGTWNNHWFWGKPRNPRALWTNPCVYRFKATVLGAPDAVADIVAYKGTTQVATIQITTAKEAVLAQENDWEGPNSYDTYRAFLSSHTLAGSKGGNIGELFDCRVVDAVVANGTRMPYGGPYTWCCFSDATQLGWLMPWDNTTTPKFSAAP